MVNIDLKIQGNFNWDSEKKLAQLTLEQTQKDEKLQIENFNFQLEIQFTDESGKIIETSLSFDVIILINTPEMPLSYIITW